MRWKPIDVRRIARLTLVETNQGDDVHIELRAAEIHRLAPLIAALLNAVDGARSIPPAEPDERCGESCAPGCRGYGACQSSDGEWSIQRCDGCALYADDDEAASVARHEVMAILSALEGFSWAEDERTRALAQLAHP